MIPYIGLGILACIGLLILVIIILIIAFFLKLLIAFLPATIAAILVFLFIGPFWAVVTFLVLALILSIFDRRR